MIGSGDVLIAQEQHLVFEQLRFDRAKQIVVVRGFRKAHARKLSADVAGELFDLHSTNTEEPMDLPASRSRCA